MAKQINDLGLEKIKQWEGCRLEAYRDSGGVWTIGYGSTKGVYPGMKITAQEAEQRLMDDLAIAESAVSNLIKVQLTDNQFAALVSFTFNVGVEALRSSTLRKKLNKGDYDAVPAQLMRWNKDNGKVVQGLVNRRAAEAGLWATGAFVAGNTVPVKPSTTPIVSLENAAVAAPLVYGGIEAVQNLDNGSPVTWAIAIAILIAAGIGVAMFLYRKRAV